MKVAFIEANDLGALKTAVDAYLADAGNNVDELININLSIGKNGSYIATISYTTT